MLPNIVNIPISQLTLLDKNPRKITKEQFEKLCKNIENDPEFLSARPILVHAINDKLEVYAGNQRIRAAKKLKKNRLSGKYQLLLAMLNPKKKMNAQHTAPKNL